MDLWADSWHDRRLRARPRNAALRRELLRPRHLVYGVVVLIATIAALMLGRSLGDEGTSRPASLGAVEVDGGRLALAGWSGWLSADTPRILQGLLVDAAATKPLLLDGVTVLVGDVRDGDVPRLLALLRPTDANGRELAAGDLHVRGYSGTVAGHAPLTAMLMLVPTQDGTSAAICVADPRVSTTATSDCRSLLPATTTLRHSAPAAASPDPANAAALSTALVRLDRVRRSAVPALASEATSGRQARAATRLSSAYADAARAVGGVSFTTLAASSGAAVARNLSAGSSGYRALAAAANEHSPVAFRQARARVTAADTALARSLTQLGALGYTRRS